MPVSTGDQWTPCFTLRNVSLPEVPFLGFSAITGDVSDDHEYEILSSLKLFVVDSAPFYFQHHQRHDLLCHPLQYKQPPRKDPT